MIWPLAKLAETIVRAAINVVNTPQLIHLLSALAKSKAFILGTTWGHIPTARGGVACLCGASRESRDQ